MTAKASLFNFDHTASWICWLQVDPTGTGTFFNFDHTEADTESSGGFSENNSSVAIALEGVTVVPDSGPGGQVRLACQSGEAGSTVFDIAVVALQVI